MRPNFMFELPPVMPYPSPIHRRGSPNVIRNWLASCAMVVGMTAAGAGPLPWPDAPYSHFANNSRLETVLAEFAGSFSLSLNLAPSVSGTVNGKFTAASPTEFISRLAGVYGFTWYTHAGSLYVSKSTDLVTRSLPVPSGSLGSLRKALTELGVLEPRFGWGELPSQSLVMISGPETYVQLVEQTVRGLPASGGAQQVSVFRLRHASAEDRTILYRDQQITTPGLATILRDLITGRAGPGGINNEALSATATPLRSAASVASDSTGVLSSAANGSTSRSNTTIGNSGGQGDGKNNMASGSEGGPGNRLREPSVRSDPRLNAVVVQDVPERMPIYRQLIEQLDVPTALIEIEAMIIDVNTDRANDLGINWAGRAGRTALGFGNLSSTPASNTLVISSGPRDSGISTSTLAVSAGNYLISQIRLLETDGDAKIQSRPSLLTVDNLGALLDLSETFYIRVQGERVATITPVTTGTTLRVTPRVISNGDENTIQLIIDIEDGQIQDRLIDTLPTVRRSAVSTQAIVRSDEALLIAGHTQAQTIDSVAKVPVLGDIPGLGLLMSSRQKSIQRRERLFMIRPRIVSLAGQTPAAAVVPPMTPTPSPMSGVAGSDSLKLTRSLSP